MEYGGFHIVSSHFLMAAVSRILRAMWPGRRRNGGRLRCHNWEIYRPRAVRANRILVIDP